MWDQSQVRDRSWQQVALLLPLTVQSPTRFGRDERTSTWWVKMEWYRHVYRHAEEHDDLADGMLDPTIAVQAIGGR